MSKAKFTELLRLAGREMAPAVDVANDVMAAVTRRQTLAIRSCRTYMWMGVVSAAAAACIAIAATMAWQGQSDSVQEMLTYIAWVEL